MKGRINATNLDHLRGEIYNVHVVHEKTRHEYRIIDVIPLKVGGNDDWTLAIVYSPCDDGRIKAFCRDWKNFFDSFSIVAINRKGNSSSELSEWCKDVFLNIIDTCFIGEEDPVPLLRHNGRITAAIEHHTFEDGFECAMDVNGIIWFKHPEQAFQRPCAKLCCDVIKTRDPDLAEEMLERSVSMQKSGDMGQPSNLGERDLAREKLKRLYDKHTFRAYGKGFLAYIDGLKPDRNPYLPSVHGRDSRPDELHASWKEGYEDAYDEKHDITAVGDDDGNIVGLCPKSKFPWEHEWHLASHLVLFRNGKIVISRRSLTKKFFPGYWTFAVSGTRQRETALECIVRETQEELSISIPPQSFIPICNFPTVVPGVIKCHDAVFLAEYGGVLTPDQTETSELMETTLPDLIAMLRDGVAPFTPGLRNYCDMPFVPG